MRGVLLTVTKNLSLVTVIKYYDTDMKTSKRCVAAWVEDDIKDVVDSLAEIKGISTSEYLRNLILQDLDSRTFFTTELKKRGIS